MATLDWHVTDKEGIALVRLLVTSEAGERVRVTNCLDGPVWPPRRQGVPEEGWDEDGYEGIVGADERLVLGYACPAEPADPPARITSLGSDETGTDVTAREVVRTLGDPSPPRDAVAGDRDGAGNDAVDVEDASRSAGDGSTGPFDGTGRVERDGTATASDGPSQSAPAGDWVAVEAWLDGVGDRVERGERLAGISSVPEASEAVAAVGGPDELARLRTRLDEDRERLRQVTRRCEALTARLEDVDVPVETLTRLA